MCFLENVLFLRHSKNSRNSFLVPSTIFCQVLKYQINFIASENHQKGKKYNWILSVKIENYDQDWGYFLSDVKCI